MGKKTVNQILYSKYISLNFFDFEVFPDEVELKSTIEVTEFKAGNLRKNKRTIQKHNSICYEKAYKDDVALNDAISDFIDKFVESDFSQKKISTLNAKQAFIRIKIPALSSGNIQDGLIPIKVIERMADLKLELDLIFI